jgi:ABC-2 type transport system ATP-binding protein
MRHVAKRFGKLDVLNDLSLSVNAGEVYGFLGRNGAGKSTAIRILMGITGADSGEIHLFGQPATQGVVKLRQRIGYVAQEQNFYPWMTPGVLQKFVAGFYPRWNRKHFDHLASRFDLPISRRIGTFSGGMKAKLALTVALATQPELLLLDEPTAGMDPVARREFLDLVNEHALNEGAAVFFSTHLIDEIESAADRIGIIESGRTAYEGELKALARSVRAYRRPLEDETPVGAHGPFAEMERHRLEDATLLQQHRRGHEIEAVIRFPGDAPTGLQLEPGWRTEPISLEDVFIAIVNASKSN